MVCDSSLHKTEQCLSTADGVPLSAARSTVVGLRQAKVAAGDNERHRCPHCQAWLTKDGQCNSPKCPKNGQPVVDMTEHHILARCPADTIEKANVGEIESAAYQMAYEGHLAGPDQNPYPEDDERHQAFNEGGLKGTRDLEMDSATGAGPNGGERLDSQQVSVLLDKYATHKTPDRWLDFEQVQGIDTWAYDSPNDVWDKVFRARRPDDVAIMAGPVRRFKDLVEEIEAASPHDVENPTDTRYAPVPAEAKQLGIVGQHLDQIGPCADVEGARKAQAQLQVTIEQAQEGRWEPVFSLVGSQYDNGGGGRVEIANVNQVSPSVDLRWADHPTGRSWRRCADRVVEKMSKPSVNISFTDREAEEWRDQWCDPRVSIGPAEPSEPFEDGVELIDEYERLGGYQGGRPASHPARTYEVQLVVTPEDMRSFDGLTRMAEDKLRDSEEHVVQQGEVEPVQLNVERRPDGVAWVTGVFDVVRNEPLW